MPSSEFQTLLKQILHAIERDDIVLPTLPDVAIKINDLVNDPEVSTDQIVFVLSGDPFVSAQIIKAANSVAFADKPRVLSVRDALTRLGYRKIHSLVMAIVMNKMFCSNNSRINRYLERVWHHSREVAAVSYVMAMRQSPHLQPDQVMLAGLIHEIGVLPLCMHLEQKNIQVTEKTLNKLIRKCHTRVGGNLLRKWNFPEYIIDVIEHHENLQNVLGDTLRDGCTDIICISNLLNSSDIEMIDWDAIPAAHRLGLSSQDCLAYLENNAERITLVAGMLGINSPGNSI